MEQYYFILWYCNLKVRHCLWQDLSLETMVSIYRPFLVLGHSVFSYDPFQYTPTLYVPFCFTNSSVSLQTNTIFVSVPELCNMFNDLWEVACGFHIPHEDGFFFLDYC